MKLDLFEVTIPEGQENGLYVHLEHGQQYTVRAINNSCMPCDADVYIDGKRIGTFRVNAYRSITLQRSSDDNGRFTFFATGTNEAYAANQSSVDVKDRGLVRVVFRPGNPIVHNPVPVMPTVYRGGRLSSSSGMFMCCTGDDVASGITGLTGYSNQRFYDAEQISHTGQSFEIMLRLVARVNNVPQYVRPLGTARIRPTKQSTSYPPPVSSCTPTFRNWVY